MRVSAVFDGVMPAISSSTTGPETSLTWTSEYPLSVVAMVWLMVQDWACFRLSLPGVTLTGCEVIQSAEVKVRAPAPFTEQSPVAIGVTTTSLVGWDASFIVYVSSA